MKNLNIVSFNLRLPAEIDGDNYFFNRLPLIVKTIRRRMPDIIGVQEATDASREALAKELPEYTLVGSGRNPDRHGEGVAFLFRKDKFELSDLCCRWLSNTPFTPGSRYEDSDQSPCPRFMLSALFVPKDTEIPAFRIYNLHTDHVGAEARMRASRDLLEAIRRDNENYAAPFLALGDFNATPESPEMMLLRGEDSPLHDATDEIKTTFHFFHKKDFPGSKIDYIFYSDDFRFESTTLWTEAEAGLYLSDHHPIETTLSL